jgi:hypothetical protein
MSDLTVKIERVIALSDRIAEILGTDIAALERGSAKELRTNDPTVQQLTLQYAREAGSIGAAAAKAMPADLRDRLTASTKRMNDVLKRHQRIITRVRTVSEGMIRAVAGEVERRRNFQRNYSRTPSARPQASRSILYNSVV